MFSLWGFTHFSGIYCCVIFATLGLTPKVSFLSLLYCYFEIFQVSGSVRALASHKSVLFLSFFVKNIAENFNFQGNLLTLADP